jgi:hypothetical protein
MRSKTIALEKRQRANDEEIEGKQWQKRRKRKSLQSAIKQSHQRPEIWKNASIMATKHE